MNRNIIIFFHLMALFSIKMAWASGSQESETLKVTKSEIQVYVKEEDEFVEFLKLNTDYKIELLEENGDFQSIALPGISDCKIDVFIEKEDKKYLNDYEQENHGKPSTIAFNGKGNSTWMETLDSQRVVISGFDQPIIVVAPTTGNPLWNEIVKQQAKKPEIITSGNVGDAVFYKLDFVEQALKAISSEQLDYSEIMRINGISAILTKNPDAFSHLGESDFSMSTSSPEQLSEIIQSIDTSPR